MFYEPSQPHGLPHDPFKSLVVPRPIGWISTLDEDGQPNLAPYSFFNGVASAPPMVMFSGNGQHVEGGLKDSVRNAERSGEFVCSMATYALRDAMNKTSGSLPRQTNEFEVAGLTAMPSKLVKPPRVGESPVHLECRFLQKVMLPSTDPDSSNQVVFGEVIGIHIADDYLKDGKVDIERIGPLARMGYMDYSYVERVFKLNRPA